jgi:hypothetical protein
VDIFSSRILLSLIISTSASLKNKSAFNFIYDMCFKNSVFLCGANHKDDW